MIVVADSSIVIEALIGNRHARARIADRKLVVPHLIDAEFLSFVRSHLLAKRITPEQADEFVAEFDRLRFVRIPMLQLAERVLELRNNVSSYDATYVALAEWLGLTLVTADARLAMAPGIKASVEVVPVGA